MTDNTEIFLLVCDGSDRDDRLVFDTLSRAGVVDLLRLGSRDRPPRRPTWVVADIDLAHPGAATTLRGMLRHEDVAGSRLMVLVDPGDHQGETQAQALSADRLVTRPVHQQFLLSSLRADMAANFRRRLDQSQNVRIAMGARAAHDVFEIMFEELPLGGTLSSVVLERAESVMVGSLSGEGLAAWLETVKLHHSSSYRHCLMVAGAATCFAQFIGASERDQKRVARAALVHDIGKAFTPLTILDKPAALTERERAELNRHPRLGHDLLRRSPGVSAETLDAVMHHHEMLDGSGYPDGLSGGEIADLTRMITIADIFCALVEERSYKRGYTQREAVSMMEAMGGRLDRDLLRAFMRMAEGEQRLVHRAAMRRRPAA